MQPISVLLSGPADFAGWRDQARRLLAAEVPPEAVEWRVAGEAPSLFAAATRDPDPAAAEAAPTAPRTRVHLSENRAASVHPANAVPHSAATDQAPATSRASGHLSESRTAGGALSIREAGADPHPAAAAANRAPNPRRPAPGLLSERREAGGAPGVRDAAAGFGAAADDAGISPRTSGISSEAHATGRAWSGGECVTEPAPAGGAGSLPNLSVRALEPSSATRALGETRGDGEAAAALARTTKAEPTPDLSPVASWHLSEGRASGDIRCDAEARAAPVATAGSAPHPSLRGPGHLSEGHATGGAQDARVDGTVPDGVGASASAPTGPASLSEEHPAGEAPGDHAAGDAPAPAGRPAPTVPRAFLDLSETAIRHRDRERFALLYRVLWRLTHGEPALARVATDPDIARLQSMAKAVRRDAHKMHAFVRFREIRTADGPRYVSWFEPEHHIVEAEAGFFVRRFAGMRWSILTPEASAHWDGSTLTIGPGARRADAPAEDAHEDLWRAYYASVFNPARLKPGAMRAEMPVKYWRNLPEARLIPSLIAEAPRRAAAMVERGPSAPALRRQRNVHLPAQPAAASDVTETMPADLFSASADPKEALAALRAEMLALNSLPPWTAEATQMVFGEGPVGAPLLFVGEQPGDEEDIAGRPFVGPAGRLFNKALEEAGIGRSEAYVTNAVKHFKFKPTGRRRLHQSPDAGDIAYYRPFLKREIDLVGPELVVTLGATALRALSGKPLAINKTRGEVIPMADGPPIFPTVHPSYLLRLPDPDSKAREYERFIADLKRAKREVA